MFCSYGIERCCLEGGRSVRPQAFLRAVSGAHDLHWSFRTYDSSDSSLLKRIIRLKKKSSMTKYIYLLDTAIGFDNGLRNLVTQSSPLHFDIVLKISPKIVVMIGTHSFIPKLPSVM